MKYITGVCVLTVIVAAGTQRPATMVLKPADARLSEEFTLLSSVRELSDGRLLISDEKDKRVVIANFASNTVAPVGRIGDGPGEYRRPGQMYAFGGDTTIVTERYPTRWTQLNADHFVATVPLDGPAVNKTGGNINGADVHGRVVALVYPRVPNVDSMTVVRYDRAHDRLDTLAKAATTRDNSRSSGAGGVPVAEGARGSPAAGTKRTFVMSINAGDQVAMFADGWIAIAHARPYHVDWCAPAPATKCTTGAPIIPASPPMTSREKVAYLAWASKATRWPPTTDVDETVGWPDVVAPFAARYPLIDARSVFAAPDGRLVIERVPSADSPPMQYDIIDRRGALSAKLTLPANQRIVGFGAKSVYVIVLDSDDIQRVERHPWP